MIKKLALIFVVVTLIVIFFVGRFSPVVPATQPVVSSPTLVPPTAEEQQLIDQQIWCEAHPSECKG